MIDSTNIQCILKYEINYNFLRIMNTNNTLWLTTNIKSFDVLLAIN